MAVNPIYSFIYGKIGKTGVTAPSREPGRIQDPQTVNLSGLHPADSSENLRVERMEGSPNVGADGAFRQEAAFPPRRRLAYLDSPVIRFQSTSP